MPLFLMYYFFRFMTLDQIYAFNFKPLNYLRKVKIPKPAFRKPKNGRRGSVTETLKNIQNRQVSEFSQSVEPEGIERGNGKSSRKGQRSSHGSEGR